MSENLNTISDQFIRWNAPKKLDVCEPMDPDVFNMFVRILAPMHLKGLRVSEKQLGSTTWTRSSTYVITCFY
jgi:hypothetical protein